MQISQGVAQTLRDHAPHHEEALPKLAANETGAACQNDPCCRGRWPGGQALEQVDECEHVGGMD